MRIVGIDENGLGPILGPLVVTAAVFRAETYDPGQFWGLAGPDLPTGDSKVVFKRNAPAKGELAILRWLALFRSTATNASQLRNAICLDLSPPCPAGVDVCRPPESLTIPRWTSPPESTSLGIWNRFDKAGVTTDRVLAASCCPGEYNRALEDPHMNKLQYDFSMMIRLLRTLHEEAPGEPLRALCGKVGGTRGYLPWFENTGLEASAILESPNESTYETPIGTISFIKDGDASHLPIAVASMVGKYLRELEMIGSNHLLGRKDRHASGYRDKVTRQFIEETTEKRKTLGLPERCFTRNS